MSISPERIEAITSAIGRSRILVLGDAMVDEFDLQGWLWDGVRSLSESLSNFGFFVIAVFALSWVVSMAVFRLKGYDRIQVARAPAASMPIGDGG